MAFVYPVCLQLKRQPGFFSPRAGTRFVAAHVALRDMRCTVTMKQPHDNKQTLAERASRVYAEMEPAQMLFVQVVYIFFVVSMSVVGAANALRLLKYLEVYPF